MRAFTRLSSLLAAGALITGSVRAQTCVGNSSLETAKMNIAGVDWIGDHWKAYGAQLNTALTRHAYLGLGVNSASFDGISDRQLQGYASFGIELKAGNVSFCPIGLGAYNKGPGDGNSETGFGGGVGVAISLTPGRTVEVIPFGGVTYMKFTPKSDLCTGSSCNYDDTELKAGLGLRIRGIQLSPQLTKSTTEGSKVVYGVVLSFSFGKM